jgi:ATP synthase protein I
LFPCWLVLSFSRSIGACDRDKAAGMRMAGREDGEEEERALRARLETLSSALEAQRKASQSRRDADPGAQSSNGFGSAMGLALRMGGELVAAIVIGGFIGWRLDVWLGTKPAFLIAFFFLGVAAGVVNVIRATTPSKRENKSTAGKGRPSANENGD